MSKPLVEGAKAPAFSIETTDGKKQLSSYKGKTLVLYFYPKDDTPGCTNEAKDFSTLAPDFAAADAEILGVSRDTLAKHGKFTEKHDLKIPLGADEDGSVCEAFGVWVRRRVCIIDAVDLCRLQHRVAAHFGGPQRGSVES